MSAAGLRALGIEDPETVYGSPYPLSSYPEEARADILHKLEEVKSSTSIATLDSLFVDGQGEERWHQSTILPVLDGDRLDYIMVVSIDVTEAKHTQQRLFDSEKMDAIGQLAGGIAHDFNNHLTAVIGHAELMLAEIQDDDLSQDLEHIRKAAQKSADLTNQLLGFARKGHFKNIPTDIHRVIADVVALVEHGLDKRIVIRQQLDATRPITLADPAQIQSALLNLALNAGDAIPETGELIFRTTTVALDREACEAGALGVKPGSYLKIEVRDNGTGMTEDVQKRIFEPFFTTKDVGKGTGMGLASVYGAIDRHQGAVSVESQLGRGTTFTVYLPLSDAPANESAQAGNKTGLEQASRSARVLVVDDEDVARDFTTKLLRKVGYEVETKQDGREALEFYRDSWQTIDVVLLDMSMPHINGPDVFDAMREINPGVTAILFSGYDLPGELHEQLEGDWFAFVRKPYKIHDLLEVVALAARGRTAGGPVIATPDCNKSPTAGSTPTFGAWCATWGPRPKREKEKPMSNADGPQLQPTGTMPDVRDKTVNAAKDAINAAYQGDGRIAYIVAPGGTGGTPGDVEKTDPAAGKPISNAITIVVYDTVV